MYGKTSIISVGFGTTTLSATGFAAQGYVFAAVSLIVAGALLLHWGRRRASTS
jgi:hypothetical protein